MKKCILFVTLLGMSQVYAQDSELKQLNVNMKVTINHGQKEVELKNVPATESFSGQSSRVYPMEFYPATELFPLAFVNDDPFELSFHHVEFPVVQHPE